MTGSRNWSEKCDVYDALEKAFESSDGIMVVVHGDCPTGADAQAAEWVKKKALMRYMVEAEPHPADWSGPHKKGAGYRRNAEMVALGADLCLAFILDGSNGASHTEKLARKAGIKTKTFTRSTMSKEQNRVEAEIKLENVRLIWRNFAGEERMFNEKGKRNFSVLLDEGLAKELITLGWNVKDNSKKVKSGEADELLYHLPVTVKMDGAMPPRLFMITRSKNKRTPLDEDTVVLLDYAEFDLVDVILRPYNWGPIQGKYGVTAYLKTLFAFIREDELELKYADIPIEDGKLAIEAGEDVIDVEGEWGDEDVAVMDEIEQREVRDRKALLRGES